MTGLGVSFCKNDSQTPPSEGGAPHKGRGPFALRFFGSLLETLSTIPLTPFRRRLFGIE